MNSSQIVVSVAGGIAVIIAASSFYMEWRKTSRLFKSFEQSATPQDSLVWVRLFFRRAYRFVPSLALAKLSGYLFAISYFAEYLFFSGSVPRLTPSEQRFVANFMKERDINLAIYTAIYIMLWGIGSGLEWRRHHLNERKA